MVSTPFFSWFPSDLFHWRRCVKVGITTERRQPPGWHRFVENTPWLLVLFLSLPMFLLSMPFLHSCFLTLFSLLVACFLFLWLCRCRRRREVDSYSVWQWYGSKLSVLSTNTRRELCFIRIKADNKKNSPIHLSPQISGSCC